MLDREIHPSDHWQTVGRRAKFGPHDFWNPLCICTKCATFTDWHFECERGYRLERRFRPLEVVNVAGFMLKKTPIKLGINRRLKILLDSGGKVIVQSFGC